MTFALACASTAALFADGLSNTIGFEDYAAGFTGLSLKSDAGAEGAATASYWLYNGASGSEDGSTVKAFADGEAVAPLGDASTNNNYLELSTEGGTLWRSISTLADSTTLGTAQTVPADTGLYIDTMVQFTPTEDGGTPQLDSADKLAIWLNVEGTTTNLMVRANQYDGEMNAVATNFVLSGAEVAAGSWHRLTVKAIGDVCGANETYHIPAFAIYLDGTQLAATVDTIDAELVTGLYQGELMTEAMKNDILAKKIFPSLLLGSGSTSTLQAVGFKGSGAIDNLSITDEDPNKEAPVETIDFTITTASGVTAEWSTDGENWTAYDSTTAKAAAGTIQIRLTNADGATKVVSQTLASDTNAFDETAEAFGWAEYLGEALADGSFGVDNAAEIVMLQKGVASGLATTGVTFKQTDDIDMASAGAFAGIGGLKGATPFAGTYDGDGKTISNVTFTHNATYRGFFNSVNNATIQNLTINVAGFDSTSAAEFGAAAFVGQSAGTTVLSGLTATGTLGTDAAPCNHSCAGMLVRGVGTIQNCTNAMSIVSRSDNTKVGGIVALLNGTITITGCVNSGALTAGKGSGSGDFVEGVGGIIGYNAYAATMDNCSNTGTITDESNAGKAGQLIGRANKALTSTTVNTGLATGEFYGSKDVEPVGFELRYTADGVSEWYPGTKMYDLVMAKADTTTGVVPGTVYSYADKCTMTGLTVTTEAMVAGTITADADSTATTESLTTELAAYLTGHKLVQTSTSPNTWTVDWAKYSGGAGTQADPYRIARVKDLVELKDAVAANNADASAYFTQTADIDLAGTVMTIGAINAKDTVGKDSYIAAAFRGTFDGDNHTISNVILPCGDYVGFFGSTYGATIKNVKFSLGKQGAFDTDNLVANYAGAVVVGVSLKTTIENVETLKTATATQLYTQKAAAGIVGFASGGTVLKNCVNNLDIVSEKNEKAAGLIGCAQNGGTSAATGTGVVVESCTNNGNVESKAASTRVGGLLTYTDSVVTFKGNNVFTGTLTGAGTQQSIANLNSGSIVLDEGATFTVPAAYKTVNDKAVDGVIFATVSEGVATLVKNAAVVSGGSYKVMAPGAPSITLANVGDTITLDTSLATATVTTTAENAEVQQSGNVYTVVSTGKDYPTYIADDETTKAKYDAWVDANSVTDRVDATGALKDAYLLNVAPTEAAVTAAKAEFKITSITVAADGAVTVTTPAGKSYNGTVEIVGSATIDGEYTAAAVSAKTAKFVKAILK